MKKEGELGTQGFKEKPRLMWCSKSSMEVLQSINTDTEFVDVQLRCREVCCSGGKQMSRSI